MEVSVEFAGCKLYILIYVFMQFFSHSDNLKKLRSPSEFSVVMGSVDRTDKSNDTLKLSVSTIITSSTFDPTTFKDDISIMILSTPVPDNYTGSSIIALNEDLNLPVGTKCMVTGWGLTEKVCI